MLALLRQETVQPLPQIQQGASITPSAGASSLATALCQHQWSLVTVHTLGRTELLYLTQDTPPPTFTSLLYASFFY